MRLRSLASAASLLVLVAPSVNASTEQEYIAAGKRVSVHRLDPRLPRISLQRWLGQLAAPGARVSWEANDCGEATGSPADTAADLPVCAAAEVPLRDGSTLHLSVIVGTMSMGLTGPPEFFWAEIERGDTTAWFQSFDKVVDDLHQGAR